MKHIETQESGRSMIEMLGVLAIIGVLSVGGIAGYSQAMSKFKVTKTTDQIQTLVTNIRTSFSSSKDYRGVTKANVMYALGIITDDMGANASANLEALINPYGGTLKITAMNNNRYFAISYSGLPADACSRLAAQNWGDASSGLVAMSATNAAGQTATIPSATTGGNLVTATGASMIDISDAVTGCGNSGNTSSITFWYR